MIHTRGDAAGQDQKLGGTGEVKRVMGKVVRGAVEVVRSYASVAEAYHRSDMWKRG